MDKIFLIFINLSIKILEQFQAFYNIDIYSILRVKKNKNNNSFLMRSFKDGYDYWALDYEIQDDLKIVHNISYNYWIRSFAAYKFLKKNNLTKLVYLASMLINTIGLILFIIRISLSNIHIKEEINHIKNNQHKGIFYKFTTYLNKKSYYSIISKLKAEYNGFLEFSNLEIKFNLLDLNFLKKDNKKTNSLFLLLRYLIRYPFMLKYFNNLFKSIYIYLSFKEDKYFENKFALCSEVYSMVSRSLVISSLDRHKKSFYIEHTKNDVFPYDTYSLNRAMKTVNINKIIDAKRDEQKKYPNKKKFPEVLIQASDGCGTISSYELLCYSNIVKTLEATNYKGKLYFKFHPANSELSVKIKKLYCNLKFKNYKNICFEFIHKEKNIEYFANNHKLVISIDQSTSFKEIIKNGSRLIYYNHLNQRHSMNPSNLICKNKKFKMISELSELKKELKKYSKENYK